MATHSSILAWRILWTEVPGGLLSRGSHRVRHDWSDLACMHALEKERATHSSVLAWRIAGKAEPGGLPSVGSHRVGHDWSDLAAAAAVVFSPPVGFSGQKYCSGLPCPPPGDFPDSGIESSSLKSPALAGRFYTTSTSGKPLLKSIECKFIENNEYEKFL